MANRTTPAHDFAPPWLKIPLYDSSKPSGADTDRSGQANKEGYSYRSARHTKESDSFPSRHQLYDSHRERDSCFGERKHSYLSSYHHSLDFDEPYFDGNSIHKSVSNSSCNGTSNSQFALLRRPHSRHDFRNIPSYAKGEAFNRHVTKPHNGGYYSNKAKAKLLDSCTNSNSMFNGNGGINVSNNFNQEFPSLQGDISEEPSSTPPVNGGVWEKPRNMKVHSSGVGKKLQFIKKPSTSDLSNEGSKKGLLVSSSSVSSSVLSSSGSPASSVTNSRTVIVTPVAKGGSGIYRALVPAKGSVAKKLLPSKEGMKKPSVPAYTHSMEILVKHPKAPGNKSEFLKALRNENKCTKGEGEIPKEHLENDVSMNQERVFSEEKEEAETHSNGIDIAKLNISNDIMEKPILSSSLEAEQRLLREMGWKEEASDDDSYAPLTEEEMREFLALREKIVKRNGIRHRSQVNFSPRHLAPFSNVALPADPCTSSSESDSDF